MCSINSKYKRYGVNIAIYGVLQFTLIFVKFILFKIFLIQNKQTINIKYK